MTATATRRPYTPADDAIIRDRAGDTSWLAIGALLGRSADGVNKRAIILGLANTGAGETAAYEAGVRQSDERFVRHFRAIAQKRGWPVRTYHEGAGA